MTGHPPASQSDVAKPTAQRVRVLVIDDELQAAEGVQDILELEGHIVGVAHDMASALQAADMMAPDVALVDLRLKEEWGLDVIAALHKKFPNLVCIVQTGNSDSDVVISALRQGVYDYLVKPFQPDQLLTITARAAEKVVLERERYEMTTALGKAKEEAELASKSKTEFLTRMGGELGQHFSTLLELSATLAQERLGPIGNENYTTCARGIASGCSRMLRNMRNIGELGYLEAGTKPVNVTDFSVANVISEVTGSQQTAINAKRLQVAVSVGENVPPLQTDREHVSIILGHLLSNAIKFSPPAGQIGISALLDNKGDFWLQVQDQGPGIPHDQIVVAMAPFGRVSSSAGGQGPDPFSAGLGLPLADRLVQLLGGKLGLKSEPDAGTVAQLFFPRDKVFEFARNRNAIL